MEIRYATLEDVELDEIHSTFTLAFSDYMVPMNPTPEQFRSTWIRRGVRPEVSVGAFHGQDLVGCVLNGVGDWSGAHTVYNSGTGVVPLSRGLGVGRGLMERSLELASGARSYLLEVLDGNVRAIRLYEAMGFQRVRNLQCWTIPAGGSRRPEVDHVEALDLEALSAWRDVLPSWQNSNASIARAGAHLTRLAIHVNGDVAGYCVLDVARSDVAQLAIAPRFRRRGLGTALVEHARFVTGAPLRFTNIDPDVESVGCFLESAGGSRTVRQFEMVKPMEEARA